MNPMSTGTSILSSSYLVGQFLVSMPAMADPRFENTVIYMCHHASDGAMGLVVNRCIEDLAFRDILAQLDIKPGRSCDDIRVHRGGPVETSRGFVLHTTDYKREGTLVVSSDIALSATTEVLRAIAGGEGPSRSLMALGYAGWGEGQLDEEIKQNAWLSVPADLDLLFADDLGSKWVRALGKLGINPAMLSASAGHA
ncbi:MAG: YqgE/AlgH family protein [Rhodospirillaceae bacterium]|nr:MAG: YqgE/AlgH family protein [Rhodospirillaceae bacterium]